MLLLSVFALTGGCTTDQPSPNPTTSSSTNSDEIIAVCYPLQFLAQQIVGDTMQIGCPIPPGVGADQWRPDRDDIRRMQNARLLIANGRGARFAKWTELVSVPESKWCHTATRGLSLSDYIAVEDKRIVHSHGPEGEHSHPTMVAQTWLDPAIAKKQAAYIYQRLCAEFPQHESVFKQNLASLSDRLDNLSEKFSRLSDDIGNAKEGVREDVKENANEDAQRSVVTANSNLKFFTNACGLIDHHLNWDQPPTLEQARLDLKQLAENQSPANLALKTRTGNQIFLTPDSIDGSLAKLLAKMNYSVVRIDPLNAQPQSNETNQPSVERAASQTGGTDYFSVMEANFARLAAALE